MTDGTGIGAPRTLDELARRLEDAAVTLARVPLGKASHAPAGIRIAWPDYRLETAESYGYHRVSTGRVVASASEIARMDEVFGWLARWWSEDSLRASSLPRDAGIVAFERIALHHPIPRIKAGRVARWRGMQPPGGNSAPSIRNIVTKAMRLLLLGLGGDPRAGIEAPSAPRLEISVRVDLREDSRVRIIRGEAVVQTTHARASHQAVPARDRDD